MRPIILKYAIEKKGEITSPYVYDFSESLNMITVNNETKAFIDSNLNDMNLLSNTRIQRESNDSCIDMLENMIQTKVDREQDDDYNISL